MYFSLFLVLKVVPGTNFALFLLIFKINCMFFLILLLLLLLLNLLFSMFLKLLAIFILFIAQNPTLKMFRLVFLVFFVHMRKRGYRVLESNRVYSIGPAVILFFYCLFCFVLFFCPLSTLCWSMISHVIHIKVISSKNHKIKIESTSC